MPSGQAFQEISSSLEYRPVPPHRAPGWWERERCAERAPEPAAAPVSSPSLPRTEEAARRADALAVSLRGALDLVTAPLARSAAAFVKAEAWREIGYARLDDHAVERFSRSGRWLRDLASLGRSFSGMPGLEAAVCGTDGEAPLGRVAGVLIARVATPESLSAWIAHARAVDVRQLKRDVAEAMEEGHAWPAGVAEGGSPGAASRTCSSVSLHENPEDDPAERSLAVLEMPAAVRAGFDEAADLYRAVEGREATLTSFAEALVGDAAASGRLAELPHGSHMRSLRSGEAIAAREDAHARATRRWESLPRPAATPWALRLAGSSLEKLREAEAEAGRGGPAALDGQIRRMLALEDEIETRLASLMAQMADIGAWARLGFDSAVHYAEQRLGMRRSAARMRVRVARAMRRAPLLRNAYERGEIGMESAWLVSRMMGTAPACAESSGAWLERARKATVKRLRDEYRLAGRLAAGIEGTGDDAGGPAAAPGRDSMPKPRLPVSDAVWYRSLHREVGTARRRLAELGRLAARTPRSDVFLSLRLPGDLAADFLGAIEAARRDLERKVASVPWEETWPEAGAPGSVLAAREFFVRCRRTPAWVGLLALLEEFVETWDVAPNVERRPGRAVFVQHGWRCAAPGCTSRRNLEEHHIRYRSRGGGNESSNLLPECRFHHQCGEHGGLATCRGRAPLDVTWTLGRGACGGRFRNEIRV